MTRTSIVNRSGSNEILGVTEDETEAMRVLNKVNVNVDKTQVASFEEYKGSQLYGRVGVRGSDVLYHLYMNPFPAEQDMRRILAETFMEVVGTIVGISASWDDTSEFEDYPNMWAIKAAGAAMNPLAVDKYLEEFLPALEERLTN